MTLRSQISYIDLVNFDREKQTPSATLIGGVDEAGRGALAGPVVAAAVICEPHEDLSLVRDSKLLSAPVREELYEMICMKSLSWGVGIVKPSVIDRVNILRATLEAMKRAVNALDPAPDLVLVDGGHLPEVGMPAEAVKGGDAVSFRIAAASIVAKVTRDRIMRDHDNMFPGYGFGRNKGYGTKEHIEAIRIKGRTHFHRMSFRVKGKL